MERNALLFYMAMFCLFDVLIFILPLFLYLFLGAFCKWLPDEDLSNIIDDVLLNSAGNDSDWQVKHGRSAALYVAMKGIFQKIYIQTLKQILIHLDKQKKVKENMR